MYNKNTFFNLTYLQDAPVGTQREIPPYSNRDHRDTHFDIQHGESLNIQS